MARATKSCSKIWESPLANSLLCDEIYTESSVDYDEIAKDETPMSIAQSTTEDLQNSPAGVSLFESSTELNEENEEFLVKAVAERIGKMSEQDMWNEIYVETGYNHSTVWNDMMKKVKKKIMCLLPANDLLENIPTEMQLSGTEWLLFDLILVHEQINVLHIDPKGKDKNNKDEPQCLQELFELVKKYDIENVVGEALIEAWRQLTLEYNTRGRQCSPMLLQLRWYQLKTLTRSRFYHSYAHNTSRDIQETLQSSSTMQLTVLQIAIAVAYNKIITQETPTWKTLITEKRVILSQEFSQTKLLNHDNVTDSQTPDTSNVPPVLLIKLDESQLTKDFKIINSITGNSVIAEDSIVFNLKDDVEYAMALQNMIDKSEPTRVEDNNVDDEEEAKIRLIKKVVEKLMILQEETEKGKWHKLKKILGYVLWQKWIHMRNVTVKKLNHLLAVNDICQDVSKRLSYTEWLLFDLILVHENKYWISFEKLDAKCLRDLFELVAKYQGEMLEGTELAEAWINITLKYNTGGRQCSPMLLQLRWYQLKKLTREQVYKPSALLNRAKNNMLIEIAAMYQNIITKKWMTWRTLVEEERVILSDQFVKVLKKKGKWKEVEAREGWYLHINRDVACSDNKTSDENAYEYVIQIVSDPVECNNADEDNQVAAQTYKDSNILLVPEINETKESEVIEIDSDDEIDEILRKKADSLLNLSQETVKNIMDISETRIESKASNQISINEQSKNNADGSQTVANSAFGMTICNDGTTFCDSDDEIDKILQEKANLMSIEISETQDETQKVVGDLIDECTKVSDPKRDGKKDTEAGTVNVMVKTEDQYDGLDELDFDDNNIEFVDDGIKIEEDCEYKTTHMELQPVSSSDTDDSIAEGNDEDHKIDLKLLMKTTVSTKRIDDMDIFKFMDYESVHDKRVIEYVELESKPLEKYASKAADVDIFPEQVIPEYDKSIIKSDDDDNVENVIDHPQNIIKYTSWLLQKPRKRKYNLRQLSKNPDFNTHLKTLSPEFLSLTRNRELLEECLPLTIDLHKAFEKKLINGTVYLKRDNFKGVKAVKIEKTNNHEFTMEQSSITDMLTQDQHEKLAEHVKDLIATMTADNEDEEDLAMLNIAPNLPIKRSKIINLPDKDQIRLLNQSLLTAEITPRHQSLLNLSSANTPNTNENNKGVSIVALSEKSPNKRLKTFESGPTNRPFYCCWAREKIAILKQNLNKDCRRHMCVENCCTCCCRLDLDILLTSKQVSSKTKCTSIAHLPEGSTGTSNTSAIKNVSTVTGNIKTAVSNDANNGTQKLPKLSNITDPNMTSNGKNNNNAFLNIKMSNNKIAGANSIVIDKDTKDRGINFDKNPNRTNSKVLNYTIDSKNSFVRKNEVFTMANRPRILLKPPTSQVHTENTKPMPALTKIAPRLPVTKPQASNSPSYLVLPPGVNFVKLVDEKLAVAINPGIQLPPQQLQSLMSVCANVNKSKKTGSVPPLHYIN